MTGCLNERQIASIRDLELIDREGIEINFVAGIFVPSAVSVSWGYTRPEALRAQGPEEVFGCPEEILGRVGEEEGSTD